MSSSPSLPSLSALADRLEQRAAGAPRPPLLASGALTGVTGLTLEASGCALPSARAAASKPRECLLEGPRWSAFEEDKHFSCPWTGWKG